MSSDWTPEQISKSFQEQAHLTRLSIDGAYRSHQIRRAQAGEDVDLEATWVSAFCDYCSVPLGAEHADPAFATLARLAWEDMGKIEALIAAQGGVDAELASAVKEAEKRWHDFEALAREAA